MRRSHRTDTLVIISDHTKYIHQDRWIANRVMHYTGMGLEGDQSLAYLQNKTLNESPANGVRLYLFEVYEPRRYLFRGQVRRFGPPFQECQPDMHAAPRKVWIFPLQVIGPDTSYHVPGRLIDKMRQRQIKRASQLPDDTLLAMAVHSRRGSPVGPADGFGECRNVYVAEFTKRRADGICQLCKHKAPFSNKKDEPYLEIHHITRLTKGGEDSIYNCVALCPNCHRKMHVLNLREDRKKLMQEAQKSCCQLTIDGGVVYV
jgi:5-methylcytosine-specific restriction protein A